MAKTTKIFIVFILIFLLGFLAIYFYIRFFLNQPLTSLESDADQTLGLLSTLL